MIGAADSLLAGGWAVRAFGIKAAGAGSFGVVATQGHHTVDFPLAALQPGAAAGRAATGLILRTADVVATGAACVSINADTCGLTGEIAANTCQAGGSIGQVTALIMRAALFRREADGHALSRQAAIRCFARAARRHASKCARSRTEGDSGSLRATGTVVSRSSRPHRCVADAFTTLAIAGLFDGTAILLESKNGREAHRPTGAAFVIATLSRFAATLQTTRITRRRIAAVILIAADRAFRRRWTTNCAANLAPCLTTHTGIGAHATGAACAPTPDVRCVRTAEIILAVPFSTADSATHLHRQRTVRFGCRRDRRTGSYLSGIDARSTQCARCSHAAEPQQ